MLPVVFIPLVPSDKKITEVVAAVDVYTRCGTESDLWFAVFRPDHTMLLRLNSTSDYCRVWLREQAGEKGQTTEGTAAGTPENTEPGEGSKDMAQTQATGSGVSSIGAGGAVVDASVPVQGILGGSE
eukprot:COSAG02_NODE_2402_length_8943_cov_2.854138_10_plen_127_part_00